MFALCNNVWNSHKSVKDTDGIEEDLDTEQEDGEFTFFIMVLDHRTDGGDGASNDQGREQRIECDVDIIQMATLQRHSTRITLQSKVQINAQNALN